MPISYRRAQSPGYDIERPARASSNESRFEGDAFRYGDLEMGYPLLSSLRRQPRPPTPTPPVRPLEPKYGRFDWARLPLVQTQSAQFAPSGCPYRAPTRRAAGSGSGDAGFDQRWGALSFGMKRFVWEISAHGLGLHRHFSYHDPIQDFDAALTVCFAVWTGGQVQSVPPHWRADAWNLQPIEARTLTLLLSEMVETEDFRNPRAQGYTLARLDELLCAMQRSSTLQDTVVGIITESTTSCADSWTLMFNDIELAVRMDHITSSAQSALSCNRHIRDLAMGLIKLDVVRRHARNHWLQHSYLDQIEVALKFEVLLQKRLNLPVVSRGWRFAGCCHVPEHALEAADRAARRAVASPRRIGDFLDRWEPWQLLERQRIVNNFGYAALPQRAWQEATLPLQSLRCVITQEELMALDEPVFMGNPGVGTLRVFEHSALMTWWCRDGRDPLDRKPLDLTTLYRITV